jgi:uncharacterized membrane protein YeiH
MESFNLALDLAGTFIFALSGALSGVKHKLDIFGVFVLSFAAGNSGGIIRDVVIGAVPPLAINDWRYVAVSILAGLVTFFRYRDVDRLQTPVLLCDAAGLALFAVEGANKALAFHLGPVGAIVLGMLTGIGGGMVRDILVAEIPIVLRADFYAVAALIGAAVVVIGRKLDFSSAAAGMTGAILCFGLRFLAIRRHWHLPNAIDSDHPATHSSGDSNKKR